MMDASDYAAQPEPTKCDTKFVPSVWIDIRNQDSAQPPANQQFVAAIMGLQALKCSSVFGYGSTKEEAVRNLRWKVLQYLDFNASHESRE